jgi:uncharacterized protein (TIGR03437 family)
MKRVAGWVVIAWTAVGSTVCLHGQAVVIGAGYAAPGATDAAPGQLLTIFARVPGKTPADPVVAKAPLPAALAGFTVLLRQTFPADPQQVPILSAVDSQSCSIVAPQVCDTVSMITVQVPFELTPNAPRTDVPQTTAPQNFARLEISYNGNPANSLFLNPVPDRIHVLNACDAAAGAAKPAPCLPVVAHADGSLVSRDNPAQAGEVLTASVVGLGQAPAGPALIPVATGAAAPAQSPPLDGVVVGFDTRVNASPAMLLPAASVPASSAQLQAGSVGIYQITFTVPSLPGGTPGCGSTVQSNLTVDFGRMTSYDGVGICVAAAPPSLPSDTRIRKRNRM